MGKTVLLDIAGFPLTTYLLLAALCLGCGVWQGVWALRLYGRWRTLKQGCTAHTQGSLQQNRRSYAYTVGASQLIYTLPDDVGLPRGGPAGEVRLWYDPRDPARAYAEGLGETKAKMPFITKTVSAGLCALPVAAFLILNFANGS